MGKRIKYNICRRIRRGKGDPYLKKRDKRTRSQGYSDKERGKGYGQVRRERLKACLGGEDIQTMCGVIRGDITIQWDRDIISKREKAIVS